MLVYSALEHLVAVVVLFQLALIESKCRHLDVECWTKCAHLKPDRKEFIAKSESDVTNKADDQVSLAAITLLLYASPCSWVLNSGATVHMAFNKAVFFKMEKSKSI